MQMNGRVEEFLTPYHREELENQLDEALNEVRENHPNLNEVEILLSLILGGALEMSEDITIFFLALRRLGMDSEPFEQAFIAFQTLKRELLTSYPRVRQVIGQRHLVPELCELPDPV
jgi:hypothetical protein